MALTRRQWLTRSVAAAAATIGAVYIVLPADDIDATADDLIWLTPNDQIVIAALLPVLLAGYVDQHRALPAAFQQKLLSNVDQAIALQRRGVQDELRQLFILLEAKLSRLALTHSMANWNQMDWQSKNTMLLSWRDHALDLFQTAYSGLHDIVIAAYFVESAHWAQIGYEPPPAIRGT